MRAALSTILADKLKIKICSQKLNSTLSNDDWSIDYAYQNLYKKLESRMPISVKSLAFHLCAVYATDGWEEKGLHLSEKEECCTLAAL